MIHMARGQGVHIEIVMVKVRLGSQEWISHEQGLHEDGVSYIAERFEVIGISLHHKPILPAPSNRPQIPAQTP